MHPDAPATSAREEAIRDMERRTISAARAAAAELPAMPPLLGWPAELEVDEGGALAARALPIALIEPDPDKTAKATLLQIVERIERWLKEIKAIRGDIADAKAFAKIIGFTPAAIMAVIRMRAQDPDKRIDLEALISSYRRALGVTGPLYEIALPAPALPAGPAPKKLSAREKKIREALLLADASRPPPAPIAGVLA